MYHMAIIYLFDIAVIIGHAAIGNWTSDSTRIHVEVTNTSTGPQLEVVQLSTTAGHIQTPGWSYTSLHPKNMDSIARVDIPDNYKAMITLLHLNLTGKRGKCDLSKVTLAVYESGMTKTIWHCFDVSVAYHERKMARHVSHGTNFAVHFKCGKLRKSGFKIYFSIHDKSSLLPGGPGDVWNCTVPNFVDFRPHFPCDLYPQCINKEDEKECPYFSEECGPGFITMDNHCLLYVNKNSPGTWRDMQFGCRKRDARLANFRRREDYERFLSYLELSLTDVWEFYRINIGLHSASISLPTMYWQEFQHSDESIAFHRFTDKSLSGSIACGSIVLNHLGKSSLNFITLGSCAKKYGGFGNKFLCETKKSSAAKDVLQEKVKIVPITDLNYSLLLVDCPLGHVTQNFLACDLASACWSRGAKSCPAPLTPLPPSLSCANSFESVPYTLVCDLRPDCNDGSDESFCEFPPCDLPEPFHCSDRQCVSWRVVCNGQRNCYNGVDEDLCSDEVRDYGMRPPSPAIVHLSRQGQFIVQTINHTQRTDPSQIVCPETHFLCPGGGYCMPVFLRCNGVYDCPGWEDEADCNTYTCRGFYRCRGSKVCLHPDHLCDGIIHCPQKDDEVMCDLTCPEKCSCYGLAFFCRKTFQANNFTRLRFLDGHGSGIRVEELAKNVMLIYLSLAENGLTLLGEFNVPNLRSLDLTDNQLKEIQLNDLSLIPQLETLSLSGNPLVSLFERMGRPTFDDTDESTITSSSVSVLQNLPVGLNRTFQEANSHDGIYALFIPGSNSDGINVTSSDISKMHAVMNTLHTLDLSRVEVKVFNPSFLSTTPNLHTLNMSRSGVDTLMGDGFQALTKLRALDLRGCPLSQFPRDVLRGLQQLETVHSDNYKLCCPATLPTGFHLKNCHAPSDEISSCEALLRSTIYRVFLSVFATLSLIGNAGSFVYRVFLQKGKRFLGFDVLIAHLCVADFCMGLYLSVIGMADRIYQGTYLWEDNSWKNSIACQVAGFLCMLSSEVSALVICLVTIDRFLVLRFPFSTFHFGTRTAQVASLCVWGIGFLTTAVPLAPGVDHWRFYSQSGICVPLPINKGDTPGYSYAFGVMIVANFVFFLVIAVGQVFIYWSIHTNTLSSSETTRKTKDVTIARRLITVAVSDFLCWFPIGLLGILAATGTPISGEISVAMIIFVLPFNSALNPFLYTLNILLEKRRIAAEERIKERLLAYFHAMNTEDEIMKSQRTCIVKLNV